jgi:hypothetical protein
VAKIMQSRAFETSCVPDRIPQALNLLERLRWNASGEHIGRAFELRLGSAQLQYLQCCGAGSRPLTIG